MEKLRTNLEHVLKDFSTKSFIAGVLCAVLIAAAFLLIYFLFPFAPHPTRPDSLAAMKKVSEAEMIIREKYLEGVDGTEQTDAMLRGLVEGLGDTYASYYTKEEYEEIKKERAGVMEGIGVRIATDLENGELIVVAVVEGSPAEEAGVLEKDRILSVNGQDMTGKTGSDAADLIQMAEGTITLQVLREGEEEPVELTMEKGPIVTTSVSAALLDGNIGYMQISTFNGVTAEQFEENYARLREEGMEALIIDLRNNLGGLVSSCCDTASQILPKGPIVYEQDRTGKEKHRDSDGKSPIDIPLVLLVNGYTASASEIFTGAVRDYGLATIVGEQTYGKGVEQNSFLLSDGSAMKLTTTVYYTPDHEDINGVGITPDEIVELTAEDEEDTQLLRALEILGAEPGERTEDDGE